MSLESTDSWSSHHLNSGLINVNKDAQTLFPTNKQEAVAFHSAGSDV